MMLRPLLARRAGRLGGRRWLSSVVFERYTTEEMEEKCLTPASFKQLVQDTGVQPFSDESIEMLFRKIDTDGNGVIDKAEFLKWWPQVHQRYIESTNPLAAYDVLVAANEVEFDKGQLEAIHKLRRVHDDIVAFIKQREAGPAKKKGLFSWFSGTAEPALTMTSVKGLYMHGGVGCGKSFMMDLFFDKIPVKRKKRVHFNQFMLDVHLRMHKTKKTMQALDAIRETARQISDEAELLCFDEFQITDIGDAMIVKRLFEHLYENGLCMVATSNRDPSDLYEGGLNRHKFLPFIDVLKRHCRVHKMTSRTDYRRESEPIPDSVYLYPNNAEATAQLHDTLEKLTGGAALEPSSVRVFGRDVRIRGAAGGVAFCTFDDLCKAAKSEADFGAIAKAHYALFVTDIPAMTVHDRTEARRFIMLIDELYERKCKLFCTAEVLPDGLFRGGGTEGLQGVDLEAADALGVRDAGKHSLFTGSDEVFAFGRAVSRLYEMQSRDYLLTPHTHVDLPETFKAWVDSVDTSGGPAAAKAA